jgi:hypothetical protein
VATSNSRTPAGPAVPPAPEPGAPPGLRRTVRRLLGAWFGLTSEEQRAVVLILALALLGLGVRTWHVRQKQAAQRTAVSQGQPSQPVR